MEGDKKRLFIFYRYFFVGGTYVMQWQHDRSQNIAWTSERPWRTGRKVGRNIYSMCGDEPDDRHDVMIGQMDTTKLAMQVVAEHNAALEHQKSG